MMTSSPDVYWVIAIDPGAKGALCALCSNGDIQFLDMPSTINGWKLWGRTIRSLNPREVQVEDVHSLYGMSAKSNFTFGGWVQTVKIVTGIAWNEMPNLIQPKRWQTDIGLSFPKKSATKVRKQIAAERALELRPTIREHIFGPRGGLIDGRVDAFLMAYNLMHRS